MSRGTQRVKAGMSAIAAVVHDICNEYGKKEGYKSSLGYNLSYKLGGVVVEQWLPGLMYTDDVTLLADSQEDWQALVIICGGEEDSLGFTFNAVK